MRLTGLTAHRGSSPQLDQRVNFTIVRTDGGVLFGYWYDDPHTGHEVGRIFTLSDQEAFWLGEALIKAKGRT